MKTLLVHHARLLVTMDEQRREIEDGAVFIRGPAIEAVGRSADLPQQAGPEPWRPAARQRGRGRGHDPARHAALDPELSPARSVRHAAHRGRALLTLQRQPWPLSAALVDG